MALEVLFEKRYVPDGEVPRIKQILEKYKLGADDALLVRIKQTDYTMQFSTR